MGENIISLVNLCKKYDDLQVLENFNLDVKKNEFLTLLGPSGCGKTTTLRIIGGFEQADSGKVVFEGSEIQDLPPYQRQLNTVFQKYALFPHMNIFDNVAFGLKIKKLPKAEIEKKVKKILSLVNLSGYEKRSIDSLSGGQQQRIAIARALVNEPKVLLLDEPLGALDLKLRKEMQMELKSMQQSIGITFIYVTHDQEEALTMSDKIIVMNEGKIQQMGTPVDIYNEPENAFVAKFIGESNIIDGEMIKDYKVKISGVEFDCVDAGFELNLPVDVVIRPEDVKIVAPEDAKIKGIVISELFKGVHYEMIVKAEDGYEWLIHSTQKSEKNEHVGLKFYPEDFHIMYKESL